MNTDSAFPLSKFEQVWKLSPGVEEKQLRFRQSFQSALPMRGRPWGPLWEMVYPMLSAGGLVMTLIVAPLTLLLKWALEKFGPSED